MNWLLVKGHQVILALAGIIIAADIILPSWLTGPLDEIGMLALVAAMRVVTRWQVRR